MGNRQDYLVFDEVSTTPPTRRGVSNLPLLMARISPLVMILFLKPRKSGAFLLRNRVLGQYNRSMINDELEDASDGGQSDKQIEEPDNYRLLCIYTPSGSCPVVLKSMCPEVVWAWVDAVRDYGVVHGRFYTARAIRYWVREFYDVNSPEYVTVCTLIT